MTLEPLPDSDASGMADGQPLSCREPDTPRLGIIHLLGWTTCVGVWFGSIRSIEQITASNMQGSGAAETILGGFWGFGGGTAMGGLVLWLARRRHGLRFPAYPGEYLWVSLGLSAVVALAAQFLYRLALLHPEGVGGSQRMLQTVSIIHGIIHLLIYLFPAVCVKIRRWRRFFLTILGMQAMYVPVSCSGVGAPYQCGWILTMIPGAVFLVVLALDLRQKVKCPWSHWVGVATYLWIKAAETVWYVWIVFFVRLR